MDTDWLPISLPIHLSPCEYDELDLATRVGTLEPKPKVRSITIDRSGDHELKLYALLDGHCEPRPPSTVAGQRVEHKKPSLNTLTGQKIEIEGYLVTDCKTKSAPNGIHTTVQADLHSVVIDYSANKQPVYITEWIENLPSRGWPANTKTEEIITTIRIRDEKRTEKSTTSRRNAHDHITVNIGHPTLHSIVLGTTGNQDGTFARKGFLEFHAGADGLPTASHRRVVRRAIEFALGTSIAVAGWTEYDKEGEPLRSSMSHSYLPSRSHPDMPPALFHPRYLDYIDEGIFGAYVRSFLEKNSDYELDRVVWLYFHAQSAPLDMAAVYVGAAYEVLRRAHYKRPENESRSRLLPKDQWRSLSRVMRDAAISCPDCDENHRSEGSALNALLSKLGILNEVSGTKLNLLMLDDLGLGHGEIEKSALAARNDAAHANPIAPGEEYDVLKRYRALHTLVARVVFSILGMTVKYYDYSSAGFPLRLLAEEQGTTREGGSPEQI